MSAATVADVVGLLRRLIGFDTTSSNSNMALIEFIAAYLRRHGVEPHLVANDAGDKASLFATIGPQVAGGVVLSGHTDVVPVAGQDWHSDPFTLVEREERLFGRGTADMKGFIAAALAMVPHFRAASLRLPVHLAFSYDEELGCLAAPALITRMTESIARPALAIIGEPSQMMVASAHRGITTFATAVRGRPGHSSAPHRGVNAIAYAAECIAFLNRLASELSARTPAAPPQGPQPGEPDAGATSINVGTIEGGSAVNIIAEHCRFAWECRPAPGDRASDACTRLHAFAEQELLPHMRAVAPQAAIVSSEEVAVPPLAPEPGSAAEAAALAFAGQDACGVTPFASEAGLFQRAGIPAVVCGPGSFVQAHQPDEYVSLDQLQACLTFMTRLAEHAAAGTLPGPRRDVDAGTAAAATGTDKSSS